MKITMNQKIMQRARKLNNNCRPHAFACIRSYSGRRIWSYERAQIRHAGEQDAQAVRCVGYTLKQAIKTHNLLKERSK